LLGLEIVTGASSETGTTGDSVRGRVSQDIAADGVVLIPAGAVLHGTIAEAVPTKKFGGTAKLTVAFRRLELPNGQNLDVSAGWSAVGKSQTKKDAATIGGAAAGGALLGKIIGGQSKDAAIGAAVGAAAGTAVAAKNKTDPVELRVGARIEVNLDAAVTFTTRS
jgi:type IV secretory pathway VirB10-like protein